MPGYCGYTRLLQPRSVWGWAVAAGCVWCARVCNRSNFARNGLEPRLTRHVTDVTDVTEFCGGEGGEAVWED